MKEDFEIEIDHSMAKELNIMCNLSEGIAEEAAEKARAQTKEQTTEQLTIVHLRNLIKNAKMTIEQAMDTLEIPDKERPKYVGLV